MPLSLDAVLALAPDASSTQAARGLTQPTKWPLLGADDTAVWGECQGSGSKPYQTQVDLRSGAPAFKCSCPSRKFPCKHGLALLMLQAQSPGSFASGSPPAWVSDWLQGRSDKAQLKAQQQQAKAEQAAEPTALSPEEQAQAARKAQSQQDKRWQRMAAGTDELQRWLGDTLRQGLGAAAAQLARDAQHLATRLVDAQAGGLAGRLRELALAVQRDEPPAQLLRRLGQLQLLCDAVARRASLTEPELADLRAALGWPQDRAELLARHPPLHDQWLVLGLVTEEREGQLRERRVWLQGLQSGRRALLLDHAHGTAGGFAQHWLAGSVVATGLVFYPGAAGQRAVALEAPSAQPLAGQSVADTAWPDTTVDAEWQAAAQQIAACPWLPLQALLWPTGQLCLHGEQLWLQLPVTGPATLPSAAPVTSLSSAPNAAPRHLPLQLGDTDRWSLLATAAGRPLRLMGEWDGQRLRPLAARVASPLGQAAEPDDRWHCQPLVLA